MRLAEIQSFVADLERATAFYERLLGRPAAGGGQGWVAFDLDGVAFLLLGGAAPRGRRPVYGSEAETVLCLRPPDLDAAVAGLRAAGVAFETEIQTVAQGRWIALRDPDGNRVELVEPAGASQGRETERTNG